MLIRLVLHFHLVAFSGLVDFITTLVLDRELIENGYIMSQILSILVLRFQPYIMEKPQITKSLLVAKSDIDDICKFLITSFTSSQRNLKVLFTFDCFVGNMSCCCRHYYALSLCVNTLSANDMGFHPVLDGRESLEELTISQLGLFVSSSMR